MKRQILILESGLLLGLALIGAGFGGFDWRLACIVVGSLILGLVLARTMPARKR